MSDLQSLCESLSRTCAEAGTTAQDVLRLRAELRSLTASVLAATRGGDAGAASAARIIVDELDRAGRACAAAAEALRLTDSRGRAFVAARLGGTAGRPGGGPAPSENRAQPDRLIQRAADSEWWPPPPIADDLWDHVFSGHVKITVVEGEDASRRLRVSVSGYHHLAAAEPAAINPARLSAGPGSEPAEAKRWSLDGDYAAMLMELLDLSDLPVTPGKPVKANGSTFFPKDWSPRQTQAAIHEAWNDPDGTRIMDPRGPRLPESAGSPLAGREDARGVSARWTGTGAGLLIEGFFDPITGECTSAWPAPRRRQPAR